MKQILEVTQTSLEIEKSKFFTYLIPIHSLEHASEELSAIKKKHPKATHHCSALIFNDIVRSNDDNEPASTAGLPMLQTLKGHQANKILAVVVRYFGGVLLGKGGLIRAYSQSVANAIDVATWFEETNVYEVSLSIAYDLMNVIESEIRKKGEILTRDFTEQANFIIQIPTLEILQNCQELTLQQIKVHSIKEKIILVKT